MKDLFKHASSSWVKYDRYEWKKDKNNKFYITPAPNAMPKIYDPLKEYQQMVLDALNVGLMIRTSSKRKIREAIMEFVTKYGLLGLMTALPTTPSFIDYKAVYLPTNHFLREEVMDTQKYLSYFFHSALFFDQKKGLAHGTKVIEVTPSKLGDITIMLPTIEEQNRIVAILDRFDSLCNDISVGLPAEIEARQKQYEYYRDKLLSFELSSK